MRGRVTFETRCQETGKVKFGRKIDAELALLQIDRSDGSHNEQRVYKCQFCKRWHLTSKPF